ncbi:hypothetical protein [Corynebacterium casei]|uniref:hypothetical protein n=1 Tax=Corynebacterium casei TaxID=160386 RepID=UPI003FD210CC
MRCPEVVPIEQIRIAQNLLEYQEGVMYMARVADEKSLEVMVVGPPSLTGMSDSFPLREVLPGEKLHSEPQRKRLLLIDEAGFAGGAWRSFGKEIDAHLVASLRELVQSCRKLHLPLITVLENTTPPYLRVGRSEGPVYLSLADAVNFIEKEWL